MKNLIDKDLLEAKQRLARIIKVVTTGEGEELRSHSQAENCRVQ